MFEITKPQSSSNICSNWRSGLHNAKFFFHVATAPSGPATSHCRGFTMTIRHTTLSRTPVDERSGRRRDLYLITYNTHKRQIHTPPPGGIRTRSPSKRAAEDPRLRPRCQWDQLRNSNNEENYVKARFLVVIASQCTMINS